MVHLLQQRDSELRLATNVERAWQAKYAEVVKAWRNQLNKIEWIGLETWHANSNAGTVIQHRPKSGDGAMTSKLLAVMQYNANKPRCSKCAALDA